MSSNKPRKQAPPMRCKNADVRPRGEWLTVEEVNAMRLASRSGSKDPDRDELIVAMLFRHALRLSELLGLTWEHIHQDKIQIPRLKGGVSALHPMEADVMILLEKLRCQFPGVAAGPIFRAQRLDRPSIDERTVRGIVARAGKKAQLGFAVHPHMLRHAKGYQLVNDKVPIATIGAYMGHKSLNSTLIYTRVNPVAFQGLGGDSHAS